MPSLFSLIQVLSVVHMLLQLLGSNFLSILLYLKITANYYLRDISLSTYNFQRSGCTPFLENISLNKGTFMQLKWHLSLRFSILHISFTDLSTVLWSHPFLFVLYVTIQMSSVMPNTFDKFLNISTIFC